MIQRILFLAATMVAIDARPYADGAEPRASKVTILAQQNTLQTDNALIDGEELWVPVDQVQAITGFEWKAQGLCARDACIPIPANAGWTREESGTAYFNVTRFAKHVDEVFAVDTQQKVWSFTAVPQAQTTPLMAGEAPDFVLPNREGKPVRLSDFRGKKVLILTWASWCGCRFDLTGWQAVYQSLKDQGFEIVAAAQDTGGAKIVDPWYEKAQVTFTALVDTKHAVSSLYQMVNVPSGVWVDESGKIVRAAEVAYSKQQRVLGQTIGDDRYVEGLQDWVANGSKSSYLVAPDKLQPRLAVRDARQRLADAHFKLGAYFADQGQRELATQHWQQSQQLSPDNWNYHRQEWSFDKATEMTKFMGKVRQLGAKPYYEPVEFPQIKSSEPPAKPKS